MLRLGFTESTLLFYYYLENILLFDLSKNNILISKKCLINWLYSTSGFYDKSINGTYFDFDETEVIKSRCYNYYFSNLLKIINECKTDVQLCFHNLPKELDCKKKEFISYLQCENKGEPLTHQTSFVHKFVANKRLLIINNLGVLMKQQYENGNLKKINDFPEIMSIDYINPGYTWLNNKNGSDNNFIESFQKICRNVDNVIDNFDVVIISVGAYSAFIYHYITKTKRKECAVFGGELYKHFGISIQRSNPTRIEIPHFIFVPDELKPKDYEQIEGGCYW